MVPGIQAKKKQSFRFGRQVNDLVNAGQEKRILWTMVVQASVIDAHF
jgi:hypothetical protein